MKTPTKILIDRAIATPLAWGANLGARVLGHILLRDHSIDPAQVHTIAVAKLLGMGSIVQATPMLRDLRRSFPVARIIFVTSKANRGLVDRLTLVDEAIYIDDSNPTALAASTAKATLELLQRKIDLYFDLEVYSAGASILSIASGAKNRAGFYRHSARFKKGLFTHLSFFNPRIHISAIYRQLAAAAGATPDGDVEYGPIQLRPEDHEGLKASLAKHGMSLEPGSYIIVNPNASDLLLERRWPIERFAELITELTAKGHRVALIGAPSEAAYVGGLVDRLDAKTRERVFDTSGKIRVGELLALIKGAACVVTNDTGPMHLAIALNTPTVSMFGPGSPDHYGVWRHDVEVLYHPVFCSPCTYETDEPPCAGDNVCMKLITVDEVVAAVQRQLSGKPAVRRLPIAAVTFQKSNADALGIIRRATVPHPVKRAGEEEERSEREKSAASRSHGS
jgi:ADP-heptose:LPS heptosyltransferase